MKKELNNFIEYVKKEKVLTTFIIVSLFIIFGSHLFTQNVSVDSEILLLNPTSNYNWLSIGRYGFVLIKDILELYSYNPNYSAGIFFILSIITSIYWTYLIDKYTEKKSKFLSLLSIFIIFASGVYTEQFYFTFQRPIIMAGILITMVSSDLSYQYTQNRDKKYAIVSILLNVICFSIYQSLIILYLSLISGIYILKNNFKSSINTKLELKKMKKSIISLLLMFIISYIIFTIISKMFIDSDYLSVSVKWGKVPFMQVIVGIFMRIGYVLVINNEFFDLSLIIISFILLISQFVLIKGKSITYKLINIISILFMLSTPFLIIIYSGSLQGIRTYLNLPFVISLCFLIEYDNIEYLFKKNTYKRIASIILLFTFMFFSFKQYHMSSRLYYADDIVNKNDTNLAVNIYKDALKKVKKTGNYYLIIIGNTDYKLPLSAQKGDMIGKSIFNVHSDIEPLYYWSNARINALIKIQGLDSFNTATPEKIEEARNYLKNHHQIPSYPNQDSIVVVDDLVIVKLSNKI